mgnify:FL=1
MTARRDEQRGSVIVEFLGAALLVVLAVLGIAQMAVWVWARGVTANAAHEGARAAATVGADDRLGVITSRAVLRDGLGRSGMRFTVTVGRTGGAVVAEVHGRAPRLVPFLPDFAVSGRASVLDEGEVRP